MKHLTKSFVAIAVLSLVPPAFGQLITKNRESTRILNVLPSGTTQLSAMTFSTVAKRRDICLEYERIQEENFAANNNGGVYTNMFNIGAGTIANSNGRLSYTGGTAAAWRMLSPIKSPFMTVSADVENPTGTASTNSIVGVGVTNSTGNNDKYWVEYNAVGKAFKIRKTINNVTSDLVSVTLTGAPTRIYAVWTGKYLSAWTAGVDGNPNPVCHGVTPTNSDFDLRVYANYSTLFPYLVLQTDSGTGVSVSRWCHSQFGTIGYANHTAVRYLDGTPLRIGDEYYFTATSSGLSSNPGSNEWVHFHSVILAVNPYTGEVRQTGTLLQKDTTLGKIYGQHVYTLRFDEINNLWYATHSTYGSSDDDGAVRVKYNTYKGDILHGVHILPTATAVGLTVSSAPNDKLFYDFDFVRINGTLRCTYARGNASTPSTNTAWHICFGSGPDLDHITQDSEYSSFNAEGPKIARIGQTWIASSKVMTNGGTVAQNSYVYFNLLTGAYVGTFAADIAEGTSLKTHTPIVEVQNPDGTTEYDMVCFAPDDGFKTSAGTAINWTQGSTQLQRSGSTNAGWEYPRKKYPFPLPAPRPVGNRDVPFPKPVLDPYSTATVKGITATGGTVTASSPLLDATQTWNASGTTFTGQKLNVTDTASASGSMLFDYQVGGSTRFKAAVGNSRDSLITITSPTQHADLNLVGSDRSGLLRSAGGGNGLAITGGLCEIWGAGGTTAGIIEGWNNNNTTQYYRITGQGVSFNNSKALTESAATAFVQIAVASGSHVGGTVHYAIVANDGTDYQTRSGSFPFALINKAGAETASLGTPADCVAISTGTLTATFDTDTSPTNAVNIRANAVSSLTQTTLTIRYWVEIDGAAVTVTPQ